jgi:hypothetical protein
MSSGQQKIGYWRLGVAMASVTCMALGTLHGGSGRVEWLDGGLEGLPGKVSVDSRLRYEVFDQSGGADVDGISHRIRYGYLTEASAGFQLMAEGETVYAWGHGRDLHPADNAGDGTDLNQLWISYRHEDTATAKVGRQVYTLDDHRFIGHVGWRQNIQSFDAATGELMFPEFVRLKAFYIDAVNTVTGLHNDIEAWGLNASGKAGEALAVTGFLYAIDGRPDTPAGSGTTAGLRLAGDVEMEETTLAYVCSYARQWENSGYPGRDFGHDYWLFDASLKTGAWALGAGVEILGADGFHGFSTPLATLHKFNGFADVFLGASANGALVNGLEDYQLRAEYRVPAGNGIRLSAIHHWFRPRRGAGDYGNEIDLLAVYSFNKHWTVLGKYGRYSSDGGSGGVGGRDKEMLTLELNFIY